MPVHQASDEKRDSVAVIDTVATKSCVWGICRRQQLSVTRTNSLKRYVVLHHMWHHQALLFPLSKGFKFEAVGYRETIIEFGTMQAKRQGGGGF